MQRTPPSAADVATRPGRPASKRGALIRRAMAARGPARAAPVDAAAHAWRPRCCARSRRADGARGAVGGGALRGAQRCRQLPAAVGEARGAVASHEARGVRAALGGVAGARIAPPRAAPDRAAAAPSAPRRQSRLLCRAVAAPRDDAGAAPALPAESSAMLAWRDVELRVIFLNIVLYAVYARARGRTHTRRGGGGGSGSGAWSCRSHRAARAPPAQLLQPAEPAAAGADAEVRGCGCALTVQPV